MTEFQKFALAFVVCVGIILTGGFAYKIGYKQGYRAGFNHPSDTLIVTDTIRIDQPVIVEKWREKPVYFPLVDTMLVTIHDTTYIALNREIKVYSDSLYKAQVSGIYPNLDWVEVYPRNTIITNYVEKYKYPSLIVSPSVGVEILPMSVFAGAGISADYWTGMFQFSVEVGYGVNSILRQVPSNSLETEYKTMGANMGVYGKLGAKFNIIRK